MLILFLSATLARVAIMWFACMPAHTRGRSRDPWKILRDRTIYELLEQYPKATYLRIAMIATEKLEDQNPEHYEITPDHVRYIYRRDFSMRV